MKINRVYIHLYVVLSSEYFPSTWSDAILVPAFKSRDANDTANYRGVSLVSNQGKLFTTILNSRLLKCSSINDILSDAPFGFSNSYSTVDAVFCLYSVIQISFCKGNKLYGCFVDYLKAFDTVDRLYLWYKKID